MTTPAPEHDPRDVDLDWFRRPGPGEVDREAMNLVIMWMFKYRISTAVLTDAGGETRVEMGGEPLPADVWAHVPLEDFRRLLSLKTGKFLPPAWLRLVRLRLRMPLRWQDWMEYRFWRPRLDEGEIEYRINDVRNVVRFRVVGERRIELDMSEVGGVRARNGGRCGPVRRTMEP